MNSKVLLALMAVTVLVIGYFFGPFNTAPKGQVQEEVVFDADTPSTDGIVVAAGIREMEDGTRIETSEDGRTVKTFHTDGSQTTTTNDGFGNSTESRFYVDNAKVKGVAVVTSADGSKSVRVYAANGAVIALEPGALRDPINATVSELANAAGIFEEDRPGPPAKPVEVTDESVEPSSGGETKVDGR